MAETPTLAVILDTADLVKRLNEVSGLFQDLPEVKRDGGCYETPGYCRPYDYKREQLDHAIRGLLAIRLAMAEDDAKAEQDAKAAEAKQKAHDDLRTSPIALKALALYNKSMSTSYPRWDDTRGGRGVTDDTVLWGIKEAEGQEAERLKGRRDAVIKSVLGVNFYYDGYKSKSPLRKAVDKIIELEDRLTELKVQA
jgi:hypothetical protein